MNLFEPSNPALVSMTDTDGPEQMQLPVSWVGISPMKTFAGLTHENLQNIATQTYVLSNALFTDQIIFPQWLRLSRFWYPAIAVGPVMKKPTLIYQPSPLAAREVHSKHYVALRDYYSHHNIQYNMYANVHGCRWELIIERENYNVHFVTPVGVDKDFTPPPIYITQNESSNQSPESSLGRDVPPV